MSIAQLDKTKYIARARELLVGMPNNVAAKCGCESVDKPRHSHFPCTETHALGSGGVWNYDGRLHWGPDGEYMVYAEYEIHNKRYVKVWCAFNAPPYGGAGPVTLDVSEALQ